MRTAQIDGSNIVTNVIDAPDGFELAGFTLVASGAAQCGDVYDPGSHAFSTPNTPAPVPAIVTMAQARIALSRSGRLSDVDALITSTGGETKIWWDYATIVERANMLVATLGAALTPPLSSDDIDALFRVAVTIG